MSVMDDPEEFGRAVRAVRGWTGLSKPAFAELIGYERNPSTVTRAEAGDIGKRLNNPEGRREWAERVLAKTGAPRRLFGLEETRELSNVSAAVQELHRRFDWLLAELDLALAEREARGGEDPQSAEEDG